MRAIVVLLVLSLAAAAPARASGGPAVPTIEERLAEAAPQAEPAEAAPQAAERALEGGLIVSTPSSFVFYPAQEARAYLERINAPAPRGAVLGMLAPLGRTPADDAFWGAVIGFEPIGAVPEEGAEAVRSPAFLAETRDARGPNAPRLEAFQPWPKYDPARDTLVWAERTAGGPTAPRDVLYAHRVLGRQGVATVDVRLRPDQLGEALAVGPTLITLIRFAEGERREDAAPADRRSAYDVPGLITGRPMPAPAAARDTGLAAFAAGLPGGATAWIAGAALGVAAAAGAAFLALSRRRKPADDNLTPLV